MKHLFKIIFVSILSSIYGLAQNVGINNNNPKAALDVAGDFILQSATLTIGDGNTLDLDVNTNKFNHYRIIGPTGNFQIGGITAAENDRIVTLYNRSGHSLEVYNEDLTALDVNRILTGTGGTFAVYSGGSVTLKYDGAIDRWEITSSHYNSLDNFGSGNWVLNVNDMYNGNSGNVGIGNANPLSKLVVDGDLALISDTVYAHCAISMNFTLNIDNAVKRKSVFHIIEDPACTPISPSIKTITGGNDGEVIHLFTHINNTAITHLGNPNSGFPPMPPTAADSMNMIELYEPSTPGAANQISQIMLNAGGSISLIYDGTRKRWKPLSFFGENKFETGIWYKGGNPNHMYAGSDKVGIGIGSPTEKLHVNGNLAINGEIKPNGASGLNGQVLQSDGAGGMVWGTNVNTWPAQGNDIKNGNSGNVGIGAFPASGIKFDVSGNGSFYSSPPFTNVDYTTGALSLYTKSAFPSVSYRYLKLDGQRIQCAGAANIAVVPTAKDLYINPFGGNVGIGTENPTFKLSVNGAIRSKEIIVEASPWPDYVFENDYTLQSLPDIEKFIQQYKRLPNIPSSLEMEIQGQAVGEIQRKMMEKIEELTLYIIELNKRIDHLEKNIK